jgi:gamma-glutamyltranspeptidase/glutathione hydrolase
LGGGGFMLLKNPGERPIVIDFRERAPAACTPDKYRSATGEPLPDKTVHGLWAAGVPGTLKGMAFVLEHYGTKSLEQVIQPAWELAAQGFPVDAHTHEVMVELARDLAEDTVRVAYDELYRTFLKNGQPYQIGDTLRRPQLAATLRAIADGGQDVLYSPTGTVHRTLIAAMETGGGPINSEDLTTYDMILREPLVGRFREYETWTMPPPSSGGAVISEILNIVERFDRVAGDKQLRRDLWPHFMVEGMKHAFADRARGLGDWDHDPGESIRDMIDRMIDTTTAAMIVQRFNPDSTFQQEAYGTVAPGEDHGTSHYCVVDSSGMAVAGTETINFEFGSYVMVPGTGIILNDEMDDFSIVAGVANDFGLVQSDKNLVAPGRRPLSSMSPTIITKDDQPVLIIGGSGGPRIITGTLHTLLNILEFGMRPDSAVAAPRFHHQWQPDKVRVEENLDSALIKSLLQRGHTIQEYTSYPGHIQVIARRQNEWFGACDPRKGGKPAGR